MRYYFTSQKNPSLPNDSAPLEGSLRRVPPAGVLFFSADSRIARTSAGIRSVNLPSRAVPRPAGPWGDWTEKGIDY